MLIEQELADEAGVRDSGSEHTASNLIALGLAAFYKWDRVHNRLASSGDRALTPEDFWDIHDSFTPQEMDTYKRLGAQVMEQHLRRHERRSWWHSVGASLMAAAIYSLAILLLALGVRLIGSDLISVLRPLFVTAGA